ncbi:MAG: MFS transporter [Alicyclobacillus sp.]|nr:MFS transporter [Alicyclobacillus sp.]
MNPHTPSRPAAATARSGLLAFTLFLVSMNLRPAVTALSPVLDTIQQRLHMSGTVTSLLASIPILCMGVFAPLAALLGARWGIERTLTACLVVIGGAIGFRAVALTPALLLATAVFAGVGMAVAGPLVSAFIKRYFAGHSATMLGLYTLGMGIGSAISAGMVVPVMAWLHGAWNGALAVWAVFAVIALAVWIPFVQRPAADSGLPTGPRVRLADLPWGQPRVWLLMVVFGLQSGLYYSIVTWLAPLASEIGYSTAQAGALVTLCSVLQMITNITIPAWVQRTGRPQLWIAISSLVMGGGLACLAWAPHTVSPWLSTVFLALGSGSLFPLALLLPLLETRTPQEANDWTSTMLFGGYVLSSLIPLAVGAIRDVAGSYRLAFAALTLLSLALAVVALWTRGSRRGATTTATMAGE